MMIGQVSTDHSPGEGSLVAGSEATTLGSSGPRVIEEGDLVQVADIFGRVFRKGSNVRQPAICAALEEIYLNFPSGLPRGRSMVHARPTGGIDGFIGVMDLGMMIHDRPIRCGVLGTFMADRDSNHSAVGAHLVRAVLRQPFDVFFSDTASPQSLAIAQALRFAHLPIASLRWTRVLRPVAAAAAVLSRQRRFLGSAMRWTACAVDRPLSHVSKNMVRHRKVERPEHRPISFDDFLSRAPDFTARYALRPAWQDPTTRWALTQAAKSSANRRLYACEVLDAGGRPIGLYLAYTAADGLASALQVLAMPRKEALVYNALAAWARRMGAAAISGVASSEAVSALAGQSGVYFRSGASAIVKSSDSAVLQAVQTGDYLLGGLIGETWSSVVVDDFV